MLSYVYLKSQRLLKDSMSYTYSPTQPRYKKGALTICWRTYLKSKSCESTCQARWWEALVFLVAPLLNLLYALGLSAEDIPDRPPSKTLARNITCSFPPHKLISTMCYLYHDSLIFLNWCKMSLYFWYFSGWTWLLFVKRNHTLLFTLPQKLTKGVSFLPLLNPAHFVLIQALIYQRIILSVLFSCKYSRSLLLYSSCTIVLLYIFSSTQYLHYIHYTFSVTSRVTHPHNLECVMLSRVNNSCIFILAPPLPNT